LKNDVMMVRCAIYKIGAGMAKISDSGFLRCNVAHAYKLLFIYVLNVQQKCNETRCIRCIVQRLGCTFVVGFVACFPIIFIIFLDRYIYI
jgi:hypothetical protein